MSDATLLPQNVTGAPVTPLRVPLHEWLPWALFAGVMLLFLGYLVGCEQGATSIFGGTFIHEWVHDARHLLGFPCH